jgi:hypothetical protein
MEVDTRRDPGDRQCGRADPLQQIVMPAHLFSGDLPMPLCLGGIHSYQLTSLALIQINAAGEGAHRQP